ncbi:MAG: GNAT family N-acetyltransferase [Betaproteobacteria bacterium]|nr:MAG: GNAT family N-acetyltransferase [Betaproteobacteria bacterium]
MAAVCTNVEFATDLDAVEIAELSRQHIEYDLGWKYKPSRIRESIRDRSKNVVVARDDRALAGFGIMTYQDDHANLDLLAVKSAYRRRGVGKQVVLWLEQVALTAGITNVFVQVRKTNLGAIGFYETLGYHVVDVATGYYQRRESAVFMCKGIGRMIGSVQRFDEKGCQ